MKSPAPLGSDYAAYTTADILAQAVREFGPSRAEAILRQPVAEIPWGQYFLPLYNLAGPASRRPRKPAAERPPTESRVDPR